MSAKVEAVISGIGGIFPRAFDLEEFKDVLFENMVTAENAKWVTDTSEGGRVHQHNNLPLDRNTVFDASFFSVHRSQAMYLDPMSRMFLEKTFEAIIDAGVNPTEIRGKQIPVMIASSISETDFCIFSAIQSGFGVTGQARAMMANRVSYWLNIHGASFSTDANWCGGVNVVQHAKLMIESGMCDAAIIGATSSARVPDVHDIMDSLGFIAKDGITRPYDDQSNGYSRSDGVVVMFIQRSDLAKRNYATILHAESIFNGNRTQEDLTGCDLNSFTNFLENCYKVSGVNPADVSYLEVNGCGLRGIDDTELQAVEKVFCKNRSSPLQIGSVKTNIGHAEPVAAIMSLVKIIIAMEAGVIPAHVNYKKNTRIPQLNNGKIEVVTKNKEWKGEIAALNAIGLSSSYAHLIIRANKNQISNPTTDLPLLQIYSTRTEEGIQNIRDKVALQSSDLGYNKLMHEVYRTNVPGHLYRSYNLKTSKEKSNYKFFAGQTPPVWYVYSGMGSQWQTMAKDLMKLPIFAKAVHNCCDVLKPKGIDLMRILTDDDPEIFENILNSFVGIAAVQIGLTDVLEAIGIVPDGMIGHSVGELGCAYADKCLTAEQMMLCAYYRGKASLDAKLTTGMMAAIGMGHDKLSKFIPDKIDIACHNSNASSTISGPVDEVKKFVSILQSTGIFAKLVNVSNIAYHSRYIKPAAPYLLEYLKEVIPSPKERSSKWLSTSVPLNHWNTELAKTVSPEYLTNNLLSSVRFEEALPSIPNNAIVIEIAPHGLLQAILKRALFGDVVNVALTKRGVNCLEFLFNSLGELYLAGLNLTLSPLYQEISFPVPRGTRSLCNLVTWEHGEEWWNFKDKESEESVDPSERMVHINTRDFIYLQFYRIDNRIIAPPVLYFDLINESVNKEGELLSITIDDVVFKNYVEIGANETATIKIMAQPGTGLFEINGNEKTILTGRVIKNNKEKIPAANLEKRTDVSVINKDNFYKELSIRGYKYPEEFSMVSSIALRDDGFEGKAMNSGNLKALISAVFQMHLFYKGETSQHLLSPKFIQRIHISFNDYNRSKKETSVWFNDKTGILETDNGVHIQGFVYENLELAPSNIKVENLKYVRHFDEHPQDIESGLNMFTKIVTENLGHDDLTISELKEKYVPKYLPHIQKYLDQKQIEVKTIEVNELDYSVLQHSSLTIVSGKFLNIISQIISNIDNYFVFCFPLTHSICMSSKYTTVAQFSTNMNKFYLVKKTSKNPVKVINIKEDKLSYKHMEMNSNSWTTELKTVSRDEKMRVYLVCRTIPIEGISEFVAQMKSVAYNGHNLRFLFILDSTAPACSPESEFYARIFEQDLVVQVLKNGGWGSFVDVCESTAVERSRNSAALAKAVNLRDSFAYKPTYLGLHLSDLTRLDSSSIPCDIGAVDFSGYSALGEKIMGFGQFNLDQCKLATDSTFVWPVPEKWTMSDAATVPYAYTMAYYTLFTVANVSKGDVVLVHAGCSEIGLAAVHVAHNYGCTVYTTVANEVQRSLIKKWLPRIDDENILDSESIHFELSILSYTKGRGVDIILNCLPGDRLHASKNLLSSFGRFVQLGTYDMKEHANIGSQIFLKCCSFYGVTGQHLLELPQDVKEQLQMMVQKDIATGVVKPLKRKIFTENRVDDSLRYLRSSSAIGAVVTQISNLNFNKSTAVSDMSVSRIQNEENYLIYADSTDGWLSLIDWLVKQKATRIIVANQTTQNHDFINRYLSIIKQNYTTEIILTKQNAHTLANAKQLAKEIYKFGSLNEVFIFDMNKDNNNPNAAIGNIDNALYNNKINARLVCILGSNKEQSYFRKNGLSVCNIVWDSTYTLEEVIKNFDLILSKDNTNIYLKDESIVKEEVKDDTIIAEDDSMFIFTTLKTLKQLGHFELKAANIVQLPSNTPKVLRESPPLFIVPGLLGPHCTTLRQFVLQLLFPVFCVQLPTCSLKDDIAEDLAKQIMATHSSSVYKLVGVSWGGILAIEIAKQLEIFGKKIELHLLDGAPQLIQNFTTNFVKNGVFNTTLLKQLVKVDEQSVENVLSSSDLSKFDYKDIVKSLTILKSYIEYSNTYKPLPNKIRGPTAIVLTEADSNENPGLIAHCEKITYQPSKVTHRTLLQNRAIIEYINEYLA